MSLGKLPILPHRKRKQPSEIVPPRNLSHGLCKAIEAKMQRGCAVVAAKHGLVAESLALRAADHRGERRAAPAFGDNGQYRPALELDHQLVHILLEEEECHAAFYK